MIHAARKRRQRARELGDFIPTEEEEPEDNVRYASFKYQHYKNSHILYTNLYLD